MNSCLIFTYLFPKLDWLELDYSPLLAARDKIKIVFYLHSKAVIGHGKE